MYLCGECSTLLVKVPHNGKQWYECLECGATEEEPERQSKGIMYLNMKRTLHKRGAIDMRSDN